MDRYMNIWMKELKEGSDKWMDERMDRWMDEKMDRWMDGWMDGLMSGKRNECSFKLSYFKWFKISNCFGNIPIYCM